MAFDTTNTDLENAAIRKGEFREVARGIVAKDRECRKYKMSVDTGGAIARAMEQAYKLGLAHAAAAAQEDEEVSEDNTEEEDPPMKWHTIPPRARNAFEQIMELRWIPFYEEDENPFHYPPKHKWTCYRLIKHKDGSESTSKGPSFGVTTMATLVKLGLMKEYTDGDQAMLWLDAKGGKAWVNAVNEGYVKATL